MKTLEKINKRSWSAIFYFVLAIVFLLGAFAPSYMFNKIMLNIVHLKDPDYLNWIISDEKFVYYEYDVPALLFFITGMLYLINVGYILYFCNKYRMLIKNKGVKKTGEVYDVYDFSILRGLAPMMLSIFGVFFTYNWGAIRHYMAEDYPLTWILLVIFVCWVALHLVISIKNDTDRLFKTKTVTVNMHEMFPELVARERMVAPFENSGQFQDISYTVPTEEDPDWDQEVIAGFQKYQKSKLEEYEKCTKK